MANDVEIKITASDMASNVFENIKDVINSTTAEMQALTQAAQDTQSANLSLAESLMACQQGYLELGSAAVSVSSIMCEAAITAGNTMCTVASNAIQANMQLVQSIYAVRDAYNSISGANATNGTASNPTSKPWEESPSDKATLDVIEGALEGAGLFGGAVGGAAKIFKTEMSVARKLGNFIRQRQYETWDKYKVESPDPQYSTLYYKDGNYITPKLSDANPDDSTYMTYDKLSPEEQQRIHQMRVNKEKSAETNQINQQALTQQSYQPQISTHDFSSATNSLNAQMAQLKARMTEFYANMVDNITASLNEKMLAETGTTFERNSARLQREVAALRHNLDKSEQNGVNIDEARKKLNDYQTTMENKYKKDQENSLNLLQRQTEKVNAEITGDKKAAAEAQLEITKMNIDKEMEARWKACGSEVEAKKWANIQKMKADEEYQEFLKKLNLEAFDKQIERNNMSLILEGKSHAEVNRQNYQELANKIAYLEKQLKNVTKQDDKDRLNQQIVDTKKQQFQIAGYDLKTAPAEAARRIKDKQTDYTAIMVQTFDQISNSVNSHFQKMLSGAESFSQGFKGIIRDMASQIQSMMIQMVINKAIMEPMRNWFSGLLGSFGGGSSGGSSAWTLSNGTELDRTFGLGNSPLMAGYFNKRAVGGLTSGWTLVGEEGPELVNFTQPGRVYTARQTQDMLSQRQQPTVIQMHVHGVKDTNSFRQSQSQIFASMNRALANGRRNG